VRYTAGWLRSLDLLHAVETTSVDQGVVVSEADSWLDGRTTTYLSGTVKTHDLSTLAHGAGGLVTTQQTPAFGLSGVLAPPATVNNVKLQANPQLVDGNTTVSAAASLDLGWSLAAAGDTNARQVGAQFADAVTDVNQIFVWVDRALASDVANALAASVQVYASIDNQTWTLVGGTAQPSQFEHRIEIAIQQTRAKYLKVTIQPLAAGLTIDPASRDVFVTEIQFQLVLPVTAVPRNQSGTYASVSAAARVGIRNVPNVAYDLTANLTHQTQPDRSTYSLINGFSGEHKPLTWLSASARIAREDTYDGKDHLGVFQWSASASARPAEPATLTLAYSGRSTDDGKLENTVSGSVRGDVYEGIVCQANGGGTISTQGLRDQRSVQASTMNTFTPDPHVTLTADALYSYTRMSDPDQGDSWSQFTRVDGGLSVRVAPALSFSGTVSRTIIAVVPATLATGSLSYWPLRGDLQLSVSYTKTIDTAQQYTTRYFTPGLRWNVRPGVSLSAYYTDAATASPVQDTASRSFLTTLTLIP
jgi:hypothetical protein